MVADYDAEIAAQRVVVIERAGCVSGYMVAWPEEEAYFIDNNGVELGGGQDLRTGLGRG